LEPLAPPPSPPAPAPRNLGQILDTSFDVVRRHWGVLVGLAALLYLPIAFLEEALPEDPAQPPDVDALWLLWVLAFLIVALPIVLAAVTDACGDSHRGRATDAGRALRRGVELALPLSWTYLVMSLLAMAAIAPLVVVFLLWDSLGFVRVPAALLAAVLAIAILIRFSLLTQVVVLEGRSGPRALTRASRLIEGHVLRVSGIYVVGGLLMGLLGGAAGVALGALPVVGPVAVGLVQALAFAYTTAVGVVLYDDVRTRKGERDDRPPAPGT
jgi:hypothetical protein